MKPHRVTAKNPVEDVDNIDGHFPEPVSSVDHKTSKGRNISVLNKPETSIFFTRTLEQLDPNGQGVQCLIITTWFAKVEKIVRDLRAIGKRFGQRFLVEDVEDMYPMYPKYTTKTVPHVVVGNGYEVFRYFDTRKNGDFPWLNIKSLVFYWDNKFFDYGPEIQYIEKIDHILQLGKSTYQISVFSEKKIPDEICLKVSDILRGRDIVQLEYPEMKPTLKGIEKHQFFVCADDEDESKAKAISEIVGNTNLTEDTRILTIVHKPFNITHLTELLKQHGCYFVDLNKKQRDDSVNEYLEKFYLLIIGSASQPDRYDTYFRSKVDLVIYYDCDSPGDYMGCLNWFQDVDFSVMLVEQSNCELLLDIQWNHKILFERRVLGGLQDSEKSGAETESLGYEDRRKHYVYNTENEDGKVEVEVGDDLANIMLEGGKNVICVKSQALVSDLVKEMEKTFVNTPELVITSSCSRVKKLEADKRKYVLITADDAVKKSKAKNARVVINYDIAVEEDYDYRFGLCHKDGIIIHFVTDLDWVSLFDLQNTLCLAFEECVPFALLHLRKEYT